MLGKLEVYFPLKHMYEAEVGTVEGLEYWNALAADLYRESPFSTTASPLFMSRPANSETPGRRKFYQPVLSKVRFIMISKMAKPEEVLVVENDQGEVVREFMKDTDSINL